VTGWGVASASNLATKGDLDGSGIYIVKQWETSGNFVLSAADSSGDPFIVRVKADVTYSVPLLAALNLPSSLTYSVRCEQPFIGE
jgi:hypothetical protein